MNTMKEKNLRITFGRKLREIRSSRGLTQQELSGLAECSPEYISRIERGLCSPSFDMISNLSKVLMVEPKDLFDFCPPPMAMGNEK
jgi:transcriptional regulator with XRE-family HTH domain